MTRSEKKTPLRTSRKKAKDRYITDKEETIIKTLLQLGVNPQSRVYCSHTSPTRIFKHKKTCYCDKIYPDPS